MNFQEFAQIYGNENRNDKNYDIKQCKYMYSLRIQDYFGLGLNFQEFAQIYGNENRNDKNYDIKQCKYMYSLRIQDYFECFNCLPFS